MKKIAVTAGVLFAFIVLSAGALFVYYRMNLVSYETDLSAGVLGDVIIEPDIQGVPRIDVSSMEDLCLALGYLHAQDRFVYMEYFRAIARSRLSGLMGERGEALDRYASVIGFRRRARAMAAELGEKEGAWLDAYVRGVTLVQSQALYKNALDAPWDREDVLAVLLLKEWSQAFLNNRELLYQLSDETGNKHHRFLEEIIPREYTYHYRDDQKKSVELLRALKKLIQNGIGTFNRGFAVYVPGFKTRDGASMSAFSYDDRLSIYPGWYPVSIRLRGKKTLAVTHAGLPFLFSGQSGDYSFFGFNLNCDVQDFILESVRDSGAGPQYLSRQGWKGFIEVRDRGDDAGSVADDRIVRETENGPVLNDIFNLEPLKGHAVAVRSTMPGADYVASLFAVPFAQSAESAARIVRGLRSYPRVYLFAREQSAITQYSGLAPLRPRTTSVLKRPGDAAWAGLSDLSSLGGSGYQRMAVGSNFMDSTPAYLRDYVLTDEFRLGQLMKLLVSSPELTRAELAAIIKDKRSAHAEKFTPLFLAMLQHNPITSARLARIYFNDWSFDMDPGLVAPTLFQSLLQNFLRETLRDELGDDLDSIMENYVHLLPLYFKAALRGDSPLFDDRETYAVEGREAIFDRAFLQTMRALNRKKGPIMDEWKWGDLHRGHFSIPFTEKSLISRIVYTIEDGPVPGGNSTLCYSATAADLRPLARTSLTGYYYQDSAGFTMNYSYSINPMSSFYYGRMRNVESGAFHDISARYLTRILPSPAR